MSLNNERPVLILLGGFLGAGKTTLILTAARLLQARGLKVAAILNDQGSELVDTQSVQLHGVPADQVSGGCFCCRFSDLIDAAERLHAYSPAVIFAEAVGSCTDISATTIQPLKLYYGEKFRVAPYSVLVDPERAWECSAADANPDLAFLFSKQIEEADLLCFTKSDVYHEHPPLSGAPVRYLSPLTGDGVDAWLDEILSGQTPSGGKLSEIDYTRYAQAEASLAWLNCSATFAPLVPLSPAMVIGPLLDALDSALTKEGLQIAHLKILDDSPSGHLKASLVRNGQEPSVQGMLDASPSATHELLLNIRAAGEPAHLRRIVEAELAKLSGDLQMRTMQCFSPAPPKPEHRISSLVR